MLSRTNPVTRVRIIGAFQGPRALMPAFECLYLFFRFLTGNPIALLQFADQDLTLAFDLIDFIVCQLPPLLANMALKLGPIPLNLIPIDHDSTLLVNGGPSRPPEDVFDTSVQAAIMPA